MERRPRILVAEDEPQHAEHLARSLKSLGMEVVGPVASVADGLKLVRVDPAIDGAVLDVMLGREDVFPLADALIGHNLPLLFTIGEDVLAIPRSYARIPRCGKPATPDSLADVLGSLLEA